MDECKVDLDDELTVHFDKLYTKAASRYVSNETVSALRGRPTERRITELVAEVERRPAVVEDPPTFRPAIATFAEGLPRTENNRNPGLPLSAKPLQPGYEEELAKQVEKLVLPVRTEM